MTDHSSRRDALGEKFVADFLEDWQQHGATAIAALRRKAVRLCADRGVDPAQGAQPEAGAAR
jgi:hypothetical protein